MTFIEFLIEQMANNNQDEQDPGSRIEDMSADELINMGRMKRTNPKMANVELIKRLKQKLQTTQDPRERSTIQKRIIDIQQKQRQPTTI